MGYLDHSTNNIIVDAVLTDYGREKLATQGELGITQYTFADDEVDYSIIKKYGPTIGKEKIEKNTPIHEASTSANLAYKYRLLSLPNTATAFPTLSISILNGSSTLSGNSQSATFTADLQVKMVVNSTINATNIETELQNYGMSGVMAYASFDARFLETGQSNDLVGSGGGGYGIVDYEPGMMAQNNFSGNRRFAPVQLSNTNSPTEFVGTVNFAKNINGVNQTALLVNNQVVVPITFIMFRSGVRKTFYLTVDYN